MTGTEIGTLEHVLGVPEEDLFDGLVVATDWGLRFCRRQRGRADHGPPCPLPAGRRAGGPAAPAAGHGGLLGSAPMDEIGEALDERLGQMFRRPHWTRD